MSNADCAFSAAYLYMLLLLLRFLFAGFLLRFVFTIYLIMLSDKRHTTNERCENSKKYNFLFRVVYCDRTYGKWGGNMALITQQIFVLKKFVFRFAELHWPRNCVGWNCRAHLNHALLLLACVAQWVILQIHMCFIVKFIFKKNKKYTYILKKWLKNKIVK